MTVAKKVESKVPQLRFSEFRESWLKIDLGDYLEFKNGINADKDSYGSGYKFINVLDVIGASTITHNSIIGSVSVDEKTFIKNKVSFGDILFQRSSEIREEAGQSNIYLDAEHEVTFGGFIIRGKAKKKFDPVYMNYLLKTWLARKEIVTKAGGSTRFNVGQDSLSKVRLYSSQSLSEQNKISILFTSLDKKTSLLKQKHEQLVLYKKGIMQQLFSQQLRFKDDNGQDFPDWEVKTLGSLASKVSKKNKDDSIKNVLTNSAKQGIVNQLDYFDKDIANENNLTNYCVVEKDDFVYNPRISVHAPVGPIKRNNIDQGVMSPLYTVFRIKNPEMLNFLEIFFSTTQWYRYMNSIANFGARHDRMNITSSDFFLLPMKIPSDKERDKLVDFVKSLDKKINLTQQQIEQTQAYKQGLLQQMFV